MSKKPEWFEMTANENQPAEPNVKSSKRSVKIALFTVPLLLVGATMVFAEGEDGDDAPRMDTAIPAAATVTNNSTASVKNAAPINQSAVSATVKDAGAVPAIAAVADPATKGVGVPKPTGGADDEGREGHEKREGHESRENHESGEHELGDDD